MEKLLKHCPKLWPLFWNALLPQLYLDFLAPLLMCLLKPLNIELGVHWGAFNLHAFIFLNKEAGINVIHPTERLREKNHDNIEQFLIKSNTNL